MAAFECMCGERLSNSSVPNDVEFYLFSETVMHKILEQDAINTIELAHIAERIWKCRKCQRIFFFYEDGQVKHIYTPEKIDKSTG